MRPGFPKCGACELIFASEKGWLVNWKFPNLGLVNWKFPKSGACELKISKFGGLWAEIWVKIEAVEAKISKLSQKGLLWTDPFAWNGTLANCRRGVKRGSSGPHIPYPLSRSVPPHKCGQSGPILGSWSTQRLSTFLSTPIISRHVDIIINISTEEHRKNEDVSVHVRDCNELWLLF